MGRFNNLRDVRTASPIPGVEAKEHSSPQPISIGGTGAAIPLQNAPEYESFIQRVGFFVFCAYILSGYANDFSLRLFHAKSYISTLTELSLPLLLAFSGAAFRGLQVRTGKLWLLFFAWLLVDLPFSIWRTGSATLLLNYGARSWIQLYYIAAFAVTMRTLRQLINVQIFGSVLLLLSCFAFGTSGPGRFDIAQSLFFANANELAMDILFGMAVLMYPILRGSPISRALAFLALGVSMMYLLETGSRGGLVGLIALVIASFFLIRRRILILAFVIMGTCIAGLFVSGQMLHRLSLTFSDTAVQQAQSGDDASAIESQMQRSELLRRSIVLAIQNPVFGVGPGQFAVAVEAKAQAEGKRSSWLGTHNSYTEVASECGLPAFICYSAVLWFCIRNNYKLFRATQDRADARDISSISCCLLLSAVVYAVCTFFDHVAYTGVLPFMAGFSISLKIAADKALGAPAPERTASS
jgi:O-antigen ligase